ncbi:MAG: DinB family protein [Nocardioidaceae bacterium]|nr:DinB family protein [Nocardioidaceae bacterium]MCL2614832.1 DinB family protein [Nocardioidaceae bacterium]
MDDNDPKAVLHRYLQRARAALLAKLDGVGERDARLPRTPTGTSLAGIVLHCANVEAVYFGPTFGRDWPDPDHRCFISEERFEEDLQADWVLPADVPLTELTSFYRRVGEFADATIEANALDAKGSVRHWGDRPVTLQQILVHTLSDLDRHAGHADILREQVDGSAGLRSQGDNLPDDIDWPAYLRRMRAIADGFPP